MLNTYFRMNECRLPMPERTRRMRRGAIVPLIALMLPMLLILSAMAINMAYIQLAQTELDIATDSAARAASRLFSTTGDKKAAIAIGNEAGKLNQVAGAEMIFASEDFEFGFSERTRLDQRYSFSPGGAYQNAVKVTGRRDNGSSVGPIATLFPQFLKRNQVQITTDAVSTRLEVDIALVVDRSGSMAYADDEPAIYPPNPKNAPTGWNFGDPVPPNARWLDAIDATLLFLNELQKTPQQERVSLATYATYAKNDTELDHNFNKIVGALRDYSQAFEGGATNISHGINKGVNSLINDSMSRDFAAKVILVMTDGRRTVGSDPVNAAKNAAKKGIVVFTITFSDEADIKLMKKVAEAGKGMHFHARTREELLKVYEDIGKNLPTLLVR